MVNKNSTQSKPAAALVVGGGIAGMRAALDLADAGLKVYLVEHAPCLGGRVAQLGYMFPQHDCVLCRGTPDHGYGCTRPSISPAYVQHNQHPNIEVMTLTKVVDIEGQAGDFTVSLRQEPRYVNQERCINCGYCTQVCPVDLLDSHQQGMLTRKAIYKTAARAAPNTYVIDRGPYCDDCGKCVEICPTRAIAWLQCIGSRDQANSYCSSICCMYATKEAMLAKQRLGEEVDCSVFIMDERAFNKEYSTYFAKARESHGIRYQRSRISDIRQDPATGDLLLHYADASGALRQERFEMVVLATGMQPPDSARQFTEMLDLNLNEYGFCETHKFTPLQTTHSGVFVCGGFSSPKEISETILDASGAAAEVMRLLNEQLNSYQYSREWPFLAEGGLPPERDVGDEPHRVGIFACTCGGTMSDVLDMSRLVRQAEEWPGVVTAVPVDLACFPETLQTIQHTVEKEQLNRVVIAGCSNRTHESLFQRTVRQAGLNPYLMELVNLRDQCSQVHKQQPELANRKATELVRMALGRVALARPVHKQPCTCASAALIIGGGLAGMTAALAIADAGYEVILVERSEVWGGHLQNMYYVAEGDDPRHLGRDLVNRVRAHRSINAYLETEVVAHGGHAGHFWADLHTAHNGHSETFRVDHSVTIVATGGRETREHPWRDATAWAI